MRTPDPKSCVGSCADQKLQAELKALRSENAKMREILATGVGHFIRHDMSMLADDLEERAKSIRAAAEHYEAIRIDLLEGKGGEYDEEPLRARVLALIEKTRGMPVYERLADVFELEALLGIPKETDKWT